MMPLCSHFHLNLLLMYWDPKSAMIVAGRPYFVELLVKWLHMVWLVMSFKSLITGNREYR